MKFGFTCRFAMAATVTLGNALCGLAGIVLLAIDGRAAMPGPAVLIFAGWICDTVDGIVARRLGVSSKFGIGLDAVCDTITFAALPAVMLVVVADDALRIEAIFVSVAYLGSALVRLARHAVKSLLGEMAGEGLLFEGLPSPAASMFVAAALFAGPGWWALVAAGLVTPLMVSRWRYPDITKLYLKRRLSAWTLAVPAAALPILGPATVVLCCFALYVVAGPFIPRAIPCN